MNTWVQYFVQMYVLIPLRLISRNADVGLKGNFMFKWIRNHQSVFQGVCPILHPYRQHMSVLIAPPCILSIFFFSIKVSLIYTLMNVSHEKHCNSYIHPYYQVPSSPIAVTVHQCSKMPQSHYTAFPMTPPHHVYKS